MYEDELILRQLQSEISTGGATADGSTASSTGETTTGEATNG